MTNSILALPPLAALRHPLAPYRGKVATLPVEPAFVVKGSPPILRLSQVSRATLFYECAPLADMQFTGSGVINEAAALLAYHRDRWAYMGTTARKIALELEERFFPTGVSGWRRGLTPLHRTPRKAWALIAATDAAGLVQWQCYAPSLTDYRHHELVALTEAIARFERSRSTPLPTSPQRTESVAR